MKRTLFPVIVVLLLLWGVWEWCFCRFYVPPGFMAVIIAKEGKPLPAGQILAQRGQKGVWEEVLGEGRHFLNPYVYSWSIEPIREIRSGHVGIVTSKIGKELLQGEFLANPGEKGVLRGVLGPGRYRMNPKGFEITEADALSVPVGFVGVVTSLSGQKAGEGLFAKIGQKGVMEDVLQPGLYYINPREYKIDVIEVGLNQVSLLGNKGSAVITKGAITTQNEAIDNLQIRVLENQQSKRADYFGEGKDGVGQMANAPARAPGGRDKAGSKGGSKASANSQKQQTAQQGAVPEASFTLRQFVSFPSRDGFEISLDMTVEFELMPDKVAGIFRDYGDMPAVVEKILMPQILSLSRLKGSAYRGVDFILGEGREQFQKDLTTKLQTELGEKKISIHSALIRHVNVPEQILAPIQQASTATEQNLTNAEKQITAAKLAELNTETQLISQRGAEVAQETAKLKAEIQAEQEKLVAEIGADTIRQSADVDRETAMTLAERDVVLGKAKADSTVLVEGEMAKGFGMKVKALGDPKAYNMAELARALNPKLAIKIMHAGTGTLWTDLENMSVGTASAVKAAEATRKP